MYKWGNVCLCLARCGRGNQFSDDLVGNFIFSHTNYQENWYVWIDLEMFSTTCGLLIQERVVPTLDPLGAARQVSHPGSPFYLTLHIFEFYLKANSLPWRVWVQEEIPLGNLPHFICVPFSILACQVVIFGKVLLWGGSLAVNRGCKRALKVPCSGKGDISLTAASFTFTMASGFCRIIAALNIRSGPLEGWGIVVVQSLSRVLFFVTPWAAAHQAFLSGCCELNVSPIQVHMLKS